MTRRQAIAALGAIVLALGLWLAVRNTAGRTTAIPPPKPITSPTPPQPVITTAPKLPGDTQDGALLGIYPGVRIPYGVGISFASALSVTDPDSPQAISSLWFGPDRNGRPALGQIHLSLMAPGATIGYPACGATLMSSSSLGGYIDVSTLSPGSVLCVQDWAEGRAAAVTIRDLPAAGGGPEAVVVNIDVWQASY